MRAANMQALTNDFKAEFPGVTVYGIGDEPHKLRISDHNEDDTPGSRAAQSDADTTPEHRAIDVMLGPAISRAQLQAKIDFILADARLRARLWYINFLNWQWSRSNGWVRRDNSDDPHPDHAHFSGWAANDEDSSGWFRTSAGGEDVFCKQGDPKGSGKAIVLQGNLNIVLAYKGITPLLVLDDDYGKKTAQALLDSGCGNAANNGSIYWAGEELALKELLRNIAAAKAVAAHLSGAPHGGELPDSIQLTIPGYTVPAQTVTVPIEEGN